MQGKDDVPQNEIVPRSKITKFDASSGFLCIACDGLWDVATSNQVGSAIDTLVKDGKSLKEIADILTLGAVGSGSEDNISVLVAKFKANTF